MQKWILTFTAMTALVLFCPEALAADGESGGVGMIGLGAGLAMGFAVLGGALGQGMAARAMYESVSRNPGAAPLLNGPFYVGMAFIESLVLFTLVIAYTLTTAL